jgi:uncharacterized protein (TIGR02118 family)
MIIATVLYEKTAQSHFDVDYYVAKHIPLVKNRFGPFGLKDVRLMRGVATLNGGTPTFEVIAELIFPSIQHLQDALGKHADEIIGDIPKFTDVQPTIQINEEL